MPTAIFRNTVYLYGDDRHTENGPVRRMHFSADYSGALIEEMHKFGWIALPNSMKECKLSGKLIGCDILTLTPNGSLQGNQIQIPCNQVTDFKVNRVKSGEETTRDQLTFMVLTNDPGAAATCWDFMKIVGKADCVLRVGYVEQATTPPNSKTETEDAEDEAQEAQDTLPGIDSSDDDGDEGEGNAEPTDEASDYIESVPDDPRLAIVPNKRGRKSKRQQLEEAAASVEP